MNLRYKRMQRTVELREFFSSYIEDNLKQYLIVSLVFLIGIITGVIFINKASENQKTEIIEYITPFITQLKDGGDINEIALLIDSIKKNILLAIFLWFMGSTVIGIFFVYLTICFKGFCLGYTISSIIFTIGIRKRNFIYKFCDFVTKYYFYTSIIYSCS